MLKKRKRRKVNRRHTEPGLGGPVSPNTPISTTLGPGPDSGMDDSLAGRVFDATDRPIPGDIPTLDNSPVFKQCESELRDEVRLHEPSCSEIALPEAVSSPCASEEPYSRLYRPTRPVCAKRRGRRIPKPVLVPVPSAPSTACMLASETPDSDDLEDPVTMSRPPMNRKNRLVTSIRSTPDERSPSSQNLETYPYFEQTVVPVSLSESGSPSDKPQPS